MLPVNPVWIALDPNVTSKRDVEDITLILGIERTLPGIIISHLDT